DRLEGWVSLAVFLLAGAACAALSGSLRAARLRAEAGAAEAARQGERLRTTLASIGDGVIVTDAAGRVEALNPVAGARTGWGSGGAAGRRLGEVFAAVNEEPGRPAEGPAARVLREGAVVGLGNHTLLVARDGTRRPIDDSAAPLRDGA